MSNIIKFAILIVGAILVALVVRVVVVSATRPGTAVIDQEKVRVSAADLPQGLLLRDEDIKWMDVPVRTLPPGAIVSGASGAVELKGALLRHPVTSGTVIPAQQGMPTQPLNMLSSVSCG